MLWPSKSEPGACRKTYPLTKWRIIPMNSIIYIVGLVVVVGAILSFLGLR